MRTRPTNDSEQASAKRICDRCVGESYLKGLIGTTGVDAPCSYCEEESKTFTIAELSDLIEGAFDDHYERTPSEPDGFELAMQSDHESSYHWERDGEEVLWAIADAANIGEEAAKDVLAVLENRHYDHELAKLGQESPFDRESHYYKKDLGCAEFSSKWNGFENTLKTGARFFSRSAQATLDEIFADLAKLRTSEGSSVVVVAGPKTEVAFLYRARVFAAEDDKLEQALEHPWIHLGPPPMRAASAGRMNARGISVFYGAMDSATALAEVRPPVGSKVAIAKFTIVSSLRLLDVEAMKSVTTSGSIFDSSYGALMQRANFLRTLSSRISRPVMPNEEAFEYLATQAVADYLATEARLDGIIFPSVQVGRASLNVVLFHHSSRVEEVQLPAGTDVSASLETHDSDGVSPDYRVCEVVPSTAPVAKPPELDWFDWLTAPEYEEPVDARPASLKLDLESVTVHHITAVSCSADPYPVHRHRMKEPEGMGP